MELLQLFELINLQEKLIIAQKEKIELLESLCKTQDTEIERLNNIIKLENVLKINTENKGENK